MSSTHRRWGEDINFVPVTSFEDSPIETANSLEGAQMEDRIPYLECFQRGFNSVSYGRGTLLSLRRFRLTNPIAEAPPMECVRELELNPQIWPGTGLR